MTSVADLRAQFRDPDPAELELIARYAMLPEDGRRARAFEAFAKTGLPHRRMEAWKWTDVRAALGKLEAVAPLTNPADLGVPKDNFTITFTAHGIMTGGSVPDGITLHERTEGQAFNAAEDAPLGAMTAALCGHVGGLDTLVLEVTGDVTTPVHIVCAGDGDEANFARLKVLVRPKGRLDLIERHLGGAGLSSFLIEIEMQEGGFVRRTVLQQGSAAEVQAVTAMVQLGGGSEYTQTTLALGAKLARLETRLVHHESASQATLNAAYLCADGFHADVTTHVRHGAPGCTTRQMTKGAVLAGGTGVFQGKFHVPRIIGQHTDADMQHQALLLEDGASVFAKPELEIYADDVECAHGNTSGALDENQLFYLRQRGIPLAEAKAMLTQAFVAEALEAASEQVREALLETARSFLSGRA